MSKRKRQEKDTGDEFSFTLSNSKSNPILASFPALVPPTETPFQCYRKDTTTIVAGESESVEFVSSPTETDKASSSGCNYMVGIHDKRTGTTTLHPAPLHVLALHVKRFKGWEPALVTAKQFIEAKNALGDTFGTKKAQANIRAQERNRVDVSAMEGVASHIQETIESSTTALPTKEEQKDISDTSRLVPSYNANATAPEDIYTLASLAPTPEFDSLTPLLTPLLNAPSHNSRIALLPFSRSDWVNTRLKWAFTLIEGKKPNKRSLKLLLYVSSMRAFRNATLRPFAHHELVDKLTGFGIPSLVVEGLITRFTETPRGSTQSTMTPLKETLFLTHLFALYLRADQYACDPSEVGSDMAMPVTRVNLLFRSLGCKIEKLTEKELQRLGLALTEKDKKRAVLKAPVVFPNPKSGKKRA